MQSSMPFHHRRRQSIVMVVSTIMLLLLLCTPVEAKKNKKEKTKTNNRIKTKGEKNSRWKGIVEELPLTSSESGIVIDDSASVRVGDTDTIEIAQTSNKLSPLSLSSSKKHNDQDIADVEATPLDGDESDKSLSNKHSKNEDENVDVDEKDDKSSSKSKKSKGNGKFSDMQGEVKQEQVTGIGGVDQDSVSLDSTATSTPATNCVQCTNTPSYKMIALGQTCPTTPHLSYRCTRRNFVRHLFCAESCFAVGAAGYANMNCCTDNDVDADVNIIIDTRGDNGEGADDGPVANSFSPPPTYKPTNTPTPSPSMVPPLPTTSTPTMRPSPSPSIIPTVKNSHVPSSAKPTSAAPTSSPTKTNSSQPSAAPKTMSPTSSPTKMPSGHPSAAPTRTPTSIPTSSSPTMKPSRVPSARPSTEASSSPSNTNLDENSNCVRCEDEVTPWMQENSKTCADWHLTAERCSTAYWLDKHFCAQTCAEKGQAYEGTNCCVQEEENLTPDTTTNCVICNDTPSSFMTTNGLACSTWKGLKGKCGPAGATQSFIDNKFCAQSCYDRYGISYLDSDGNEEKCCEP
jgi:hypothetical protein